MVKKEEKEEEIGNVNRMGKRARKKSAGKRDKQRQASAVTRKADVLNEIKQLSI